MLLSSVALMAIFAACERIRLQHRRQVVKHQLWLQAMMHLRQQAMLPRLRFRQMHENLQNALRTESGASDLVDVEVGRAEMSLNTPHVPFLPQIVNLIQLNIPNEEEMLDESKNDS